MKDEISMAISTPTANYYIDVVKILIEQGMRWYAESTSVHEHFWEYHKSYTHVIVSNNKYLTYCGSCYINLNKLIVIEAEQFLCMNISNYFKKKYDLK